MKSNLKLAAVALAWAGVSGNAYSVPASLPAAGFSFSLAIDSTNAASYHASLASFNDIDRLSLAAPSNTTVRTISFNRVGRRAQPPSSTTLQAISLFRDPGRIGDAGVHTSAGREIQRGNASVILASTNVADGHSDFQPARSAVATQGGQYQVAANTGHISEPATFALMLTGLGLMGFIARRRMKQY